MNKVTENNMQFPMINPQPIKNYWTKCSDPKCMWEAHQREDLKVCKCLQCRETFIRLEQERERSPKRGSGFGPLSLLGPMPIVSSTEEKKYLPIQGTCNCTPCKEVFIRKRAKIIAEQDRLYIQNEKRGPNSRLDSQKPSKLERLPRCILEKITRQLDEPKDFCNFNAACKSIHKMTNELYSESEFQKLREKQKNMKAEIATLRGPNGFDGYMDKCTQHLKSLHQQRSKINTEILTLSTQSSQMIFGADETHMSLFFEGQKTNRDQLIKQKKEIQAEINKQQYHLAQLQKKLDSYVTQWDNQGNMIEGEYLELSKQTLKSFKELFA